MNDDLLSQFIFQARKDKKAVELFTTCNERFIIEPWDNYDFKQDTLVTKTSMVSLDEIAAARLIPNKSNREKEKMINYTPSKKSMRMIG